MYWPTCLIPKANEAELNGDTEHAQSAPDLAPTLERCMENCKRLPLEACTYWTWYRENSTCIFRGLLKISGTSKEGMEAVTGEKYCTSKSEMIDIYDLPIITTIVFEFE